MSYPEAAPKRQGARGKRKKKTLGRFRSNNIGFVPKIVRIVRRGVIGLFFSGSDGRITKKKR